MIPYRVWQRAGDAAESVRRRGESSTDSGASRRNPFSMPRRVVPVKNSERQTLFPWACKQGGTVGQSNLLTPDFMSGVGFFSFSP